MAETPVHRDVMILLIQTLEDHFKDRPAVYVSGSMMLYDEEGNTHSSLSPDVQVTIAAPEIDGRHVYLVWRDGPPTFVLEVTSRSIRRNDRERKHGRYARMGVAAYFLFDPLAEYLRPSLRGDRLVDGAYQPIAPADDGSLTSATLGLRLVVVGDMVRLFDLATGQVLLTRNERAAVEAQRADAEARRADAQERRADAEARRANALAQELAEERRYCPAFEARLAELERRFPPDSDA